MDNFACEMTSAIPAGENILENTVQGTCTQMYLMVKNSKWKQWVRIKNSAFA
jgi:hypothetical protein